MSGRSSGEREDRQWVYVDSKDRDLTSTSNEDFTITLSKTATRVRRVRITDIQIPYSFYPINANNNVLEFNDAGATLQSAVITPGSYTANELATELQTVMSGLQAGFTVTYDAKTFKYNWANAANFEILTSGSMAPFVGVTTASGVTNNFTGQGAIDIGGPNYFFIKSSALVRPKIYKPYNNANEDTILYKMPIATGPGTVISDKNIENEFALKYGANQNFTTLDFQLEDPDGNTPDLNGVNWTFSLILETN